ncbi:hypothetical protein [Thalassobacillus devorans]|uniref:hypothetical protein n=1 Tax=Thalassobacillus devorans TaxID=279813 RepID=UPI001593AB23|nr:hypothetical protein [Thalassobacillus devorans]
MKKLVVVISLIFVLFGSLEQLDNPGKFIGNNLQLKQKVMQSSDPGDGGMGSWK